nr:reverse transcriptase domain-containing protein [Tanacetum cinerariifolium]
EAAKFVGDFKSLAKETDESLAQQKALELEIERLLKVVVSNQKDITRDTSANTKFVKQSIEENLSKVDESHALSKLVTSNSVSRPQEPKVVNNDKVIAPGMFRIDSFTTSKEEEHVPNTVIQIYLWCIDSSCSKHMTGNLKFFINFIWKFMGTVRFGNDHVATVLGFSDLQWGNILITRVYFVEGLGIKLCLDKTEAVLQLPSLRTIKKVQSLNGKLASLNRFLSKSAEKSLPLFKTLKKCIKKINFHWTSKAKQAFKQLKQHLSELPLLVAPEPKEELIVYLSASYGAISAVLMAERGMV